ENPSAMRRRRCGSWMVGVGCGVGGEAWQASTNVQATTTLRDPPVADTSDTTILMGGYRVGAPIGMGAMANVVEAVNVQTGERVALKVLNSDWAGRAEVVSRLVREGRALQRLQHPN